MPLSTALLPAQPIAALTHLGGALVALCLAGRLLGAAGPSAPRRRVLALFVGAIVLQLGVSGIYHCFSLGTGARVILQRADHAAIWLTVVGCFLPVRHYLFPSTFGARLQVVVASVAFAGLLVETALHAVIPSWAVVLLYVVFGSVGTPVAIWLVATRGLRYTLPFFCCGVLLSLGAICELIEEPVLLPGWVEYHEVVHVLVLGGLFCHWVFVTRLTHEARSADASEPAADSSAASEAEPVEALASEPASLG